MKIYVCQIETESVGVREVVAAFSNLDEALEKMRVEYEGYKDSHPTSEVHWEQ